MPGQSHHSCCSAHTLMLPLSAGPHGLRCAEGTDLWAGHSSCHCHGEKRGSSMLSISIVSVPASESAEHRQCSHPLSVVLLVLCQSVAVFISANANVSQRLNQPSSSARGHPNPHYHFPPSRLRSWTNCRRPCQTLDRPTQSA